MSGRSCGNKSWNGTSSVRLEVNVERKSRPVRSKRLAGLLGKPGAGEQRPAKYQRRQETRDKEKRRSPVRHLQRCLRTLQDSFVVWMRSFERGDDGVPPRLRHPRNLGQVEQPAEYRAGDPENTSGGSGYVPRGFEAATQPSYSPSTSPSFWEIKIS